MKRMLAVVAVLVAGAVTVLVVNGNRGPEVTGREYADRIAAGDWSAAAAMVEPSGSDPKTLAAAVERITVVDVFSVNDDEVAVDYQLGGKASTVRLAVRQQPDELGMLERWSMEDPLLIRVNAAPNQLSRGIVVAGVRVPPGGSLKLFPGAYEVAGVPSRYLTAKPAVLMVDHFHSSLHGEVDAHLQYRATDELRTLLQDKITEHLTSCFGGSGAPDCPENLRLFRDEATGFAITEQPRLDTVEVYHGTLALRFKTTGGRMTYVRDGEQVSRDLTVYGAVEVSLDDTVKVTFTNQF
ncbi:hypothetical protein [Actinokineospora sp. HUAS TT18]|uniref:hypothetical protein n=1 Tax=Actinokineospora sp. HUAS TT18 TaxID=3447451 RepID=UPI003F520582